MRSPSEPTNSGAADGQAANPPPGEERHLAAAMVDKPKLNHFVQLKGAWGMSAAAIIYRSHELEYIDDSRYRALQIQMSKWRKSEPGEFQPVAGTLFGRLVEVNGGIAEVAKRLGVNAKHLGALLNWKHLRLA